jgi:hypothetical protein
MKFTTDQFQERTDRLGFSIARQLSEQTADVSHDIGERLRFARQKAIAQQKIQPLPASQFVLGTHGGLSMSASGSDKPGLWSILGSVIPPLLLLAGFVTFMVDSQSERIEEIARIDAELLADDVPPAAYVDPGFVQFLQEMTRVQKRHD